MLLQEGKLRRGLNLVNKMLQKKKSPCRSWSRQAARLELTLPLHIDLKLCERQCDPNREEKRLLMSSLKKKIDYTES